MNVVLNVEEVEGVLSLVTSHVLDHVEISDQAASRIRDWRSSRSVGARPLDEYAEVMNAAIGNYIDERTTRMLRKQGKYYVSGADEQSG